MARLRKIGSIDDAIREQEEAVMKAKQKYEVEADKLKDLLAKRNEVRRKTLLDAIENSSRTYDEILAFIQGTDSYDR